MSLSKLPTELVQFITDNLHDERSLNAWAQTCRGLYDIVNPVLYRYNHRTRVVEPSKMIENVLCDLAGYYQAISPSTYNPASLNILRQHIPHPTAHFSALHWASEKGVAETIQRALAAGIDVADVAKVCRMLNLTHIAAAKGHYDVLALFLSLPGVQVDHKENTKHHTPLHYAARTNAVNTAELLIRAGACLHSKSKRGNNPLHVAAYHSSTDVMELLKRHGAFLEAFGEDVHTPLSCAAMLTYSTASVKCLLDLGADPNALVNLIHTPLTVAIRHRNAATVDLLLSHGASTSHSLITNSHTVLEVALEEAYIPVLEVIFRHEPNILQEILKDGRPSPLVTQCEYAHKAVVEFLLDKGIDIELLNPDGYTALSKAVLEGTVAIVRVLLERGADPNRWARCGETVVALAIRTGNHNALSALLEHGANPNGGVTGTPIWIPHDMQFMVEPRVPLCKAGSTPPLHVAIEYRATTAVKILLEHGADPNITANGHTPLYYAVTAYQVDLDIISLLLSYGANPNIEKSVAHMPLIWSRSLYVDRGEMEVMRLLLEHGANPNIKAPDGTPLLYNAVLEDNFKAVDLLLKHGADPNIATPASKNPLSSAFDIYWPDEHEIVRHLTENGADPYVMHQEGVTALYQAVENENTDVVRQLLEYSADPSYATPVGDTPLALARTTGQEEMVALILRYTKETKE